MTIPKPESYRAFLLRLWLVQEDGKPVWRVSLEDIHTGERRAFANLDALRSFFEEMEPAAKLSEGPAEGL